MLESNPLSSNRAQYRFPHTCTHINSSSHSETPQSTFVTEVWSATDGYTTHHVRESMCYSNNHAEFWCANVTLQWVPIVRTSCATGFNTAHAHLTNTQLWLKLRGTFERSSVNGEVLIVCCIHCMALVWRNYGPRLQLATGFKMLKLILSFH